MQYKCNYCDPTTKKGEKPVKTVDTDIHEFVKDEKNKYYHLECFREHLIKRKKIADEGEISEITNKLFEKTKIDIVENIQKDAFLKWIMNFYDGSLPAYFLIKLQSIRNGTHESINEPINYETLLDIYTYMEKYLEKRAAIKKIERVSQRMNYDLAVVLGNYGEYKKFKQKQKGFRANENEIDRQIEVENKISKRNVTDNQKKTDNEDFNIADIMDDLLL